MRFTSRISLLLVLTTFFTTTLQAQLPKPEGPHCVGKQKLLIDNQERPELYTEDESDFRKIVLDVWYPGNCKGKPSSYMHPEVQRLFLEDRKIPDTLDLTLFENAKSHSFQKSPVDPSIKKAPVLLFSHGASTPIEVYTTMFEHLASHGYFVFAISHVYNTAATEFPDGSIIPKNGAYFDRAWTKEVGENFSAMMDFVKSDKPSQEKQEVVKKLYSSGFPSTLHMEIWRKDIEDAINKVESLQQDSKSIFYEKLDLQRIGGFGHSYGGSAMGHSMMSGGKLKAAVNLDGWQFGDRVIGNSFKKPFLYVRGGYPQPDALNKVVYEQAGDHLTQIKIDGTLHPNFGDLPLLTGPDNVFGTGSIDPLRSTKIVNDLLLQFFNATFGEQKDSWKSIEKKYSEVSIEELYK